MLKLLKRDVGVPENGNGHYFRYRHRETGHWSEAFDWWTWQERIALHRRANNLTPITVEESEDQLCRTLPPGWCKQDSGDMPANVPTRFGWSQLVEGMKAFAKLAMSGFVDQSEADRRADICTTCYFNVNPTGCGTCVKMATLITGDVAGRTTSEDVNLKACAVCTCALKAMVHFPIQSLGEGNQDLFPSFCWRKATGENFRLA